jgi:hypothetical protein
VTAQQCEATDWRSVGFIHGSDGGAKSDFEDLSTACAKTGVVSDFAAYEAGYEEGLAEYCTPDGVYRTAREGTPYLGQCPEPDEAFLEALEHGQAYYRIAKEIRRIEYNHTYYRPRFGFGYFGYGHRYRRSGVGIGFQFPLYSSYPYDRDRLRDLRDELDYYASWPPAT